MSAAPAGAKKPADRKPKIDPASTSMAVRVRGIDLTVEAGALDDFELLDDLNALQEGKAARLPSVLRRLVGDDGFRAAMAALRDPETGRVTSEAGAALVNEVFEALNPN